MSEAATGIPFGQPILVGHHSEARHRRAIDRASRAMDASIAESKRAGDLRAKAAAVGTGGISADDPEAIDKLKEQLAEAETTQRDMKAANKIVLKWARKGVTGETEGPDFDAYAAALAEVRPIFTPTLARQLITRNMGCIGFAPFQLTNNSANMRRIRQRIEVLEKAATRESRETRWTGGIIITESTEENRLQIAFPGKPDAATRDALKSNGFRWAPSQDAWQRQLTNAAIYAGRRVIAALGLTPEEN